MGGKWRWFGVILVAWFGACQSQPEPRSFCYWKTELRWETADTQLWQQLGGQHLYLRFFDLDWSAPLAQAVPRASLKVAAGAQLPPEVAIVPVLFIVNRSLENQTPEAMVPLAKKIWRKLLSMGHRQHLLPPAQVWTTVLVDCDWTALTETRYFALLRALRALAPRTEWQCTLRLHQYQATNIPPVARVLLMCYNTDPLARYATTNAILNLATVEKYLQSRHHPYPRPLDLALPLFFWGAWFREGQFQGLLRDWPAPGAPPAYLQPQGGNRWRVTRDTVVQGCFLRSGDHIRADGPSRAQLRVLRHLIRRYLQPAPQRMVWFDWEPSRLRQHRQWLEEAYQPR